MALQTADWKKPPAAYLSRSINVRGKAIGKEEMDLIAQIDFVLFTFINWCSINEQLEIR